MKRRRDNVANNDDRIIFSDTESSGDESAPLQLVPRQSLVKTREATQLASAHGGSGDEVAAPNASGQGIAADDDSLDAQTLAEAQYRSLFSMPATESASAPPSPFLAHLLEKHFGVTSGALRPGQQETIANILNGHSTLTILPTGWGKSLCYQLPIFTLRRLADFRSRRTGQPAEYPFVVVVSPLLALISDQLSSIRATTGISAVAVTSTSGRDFEERVYDTLRCATSCTIDVVFVSPEAFVNKIRLRDTLRQCFARIAYVCIDEAHCISEWSHDFRPSYLFLRNALESLCPPSCRAPPILALTATANPRVCEELCTYLSIRRVVSRLVPRTNVVLHASPLQPVGQCTTHPSDWTKSMHNAVTKLLDEVNLPALVYATTQMDVDEIAATVRQKFAARPEPDDDDAARSRTASAAQGFFNSSATKRRTLRVVSFHAGLPQGQRSAAQRAFLRDEVDVMVATIAFGMGINKPNIRTVIHCSAPASLGSYSQEVGRAGRDGLRADCFLIYDPAEFFLRRRRVLSHMMSFSDWKQIVVAILTATPTERGDRVIEVSAGKIAGEVLCPPETVETILFSLLKLHPCLLKSLHGKSFVSARVLAAVDREDDGSAATTGADEGGQDAQRQGSNPADGPLSRHRQAARRSQFERSFHGLLHQLDVVCPVQTMCRANVKGSIGSIVEAANATELSLSDFLFRLKALESSQQVTLRWFNYAFLVQCGPNYPPPADIVDRIAKDLYGTMVARVQHNIQLLSELFAFLTNPSQEAMVQRLNSGDRESSTSWSPPAPRLTRLQAVEIANDFVRTNRLRLRDSFEGARALAGVAPLSSSVTPDAGGLAPLCGQWYMQDSRFGSLQEFDFAWIQKVVAANNVDGQASKP